jgi:hypothetical protein
MRATANWRRWAVGTIVALLLMSVMVPRIWHRAARGHFPLLGLHVDAVSMQGSIGIPGQTTLYWPELSNFRFWPARFTACDFISDTLTPGTEYAYGVQRWNPSTSSWDNVSLPEPEWFCEPEPLSKGDTHQRRRYIWPGQTVKVIGFEAVGAREEFRQGDLARFVVFRNVARPLDWGAAIASNGFRIEDDVEPTTMEFRLRH